jgi:hypothetical protein
VTSKDERLDGRDEHVPRIFIHGGGRRDRLVECAAGSNGVVNGVVFGLFAWNSSWAADDSFVYQTTNVPV